MDKAVSRLILIPYYGGDGQAAPSDKNKRPGYLKSTLESLRDFGDEIVVGVCRLEDLDATDGHGFLLESEPHYLPTTLCQWAQEYAAGYEQVYVTEADQILHYDPKALSQVEGDSYLVPHRLEQLGQQREGDHRGELVDYEGREYVICNGTPKGAGYYTPALPIDRYGGAFLCTMELFNRVNFLRASDMYVEHATGFDIMEEGQAIKTSAWRGFFVEHLSGYEYHEKLGRR